MKGLSKKLLSVLLAILMVVTTIPAFSIAVQADEEVRDKYLFAYFSGDDIAGQPITYQKIRLAVSDDGINFNPLNANLPLLDNSEDSSKSINFNGTWGHFPHTDGARDPYIINKRDSSNNIIPGKYFIVATDLSVITGNASNTYNNTKMLVYDIDGTYYDEDENVNKPLNIYTIDHAKPYVLDTAGMFGNIQDAGDKNGRNKKSMAESSDAIAWAPEVTWDYQAHKYVLFWSGPFHASSKLNYAYTTDFRTFQDKDGNTIDGVNYFPSTLLSAPSGYKSIIDGTIAYDNGTYYLAYKTQLMSDGKEDGQIFLAKANSIAGLASASSVKYYDSRFQGKQSYDAQALEGPELFKRHADGHWILLVDNYTVNPNFNYLMYDLGTDISAVMNQGSSYDHQTDEIRSTNINSLMPRHGGMASITASELNNLNVEYAGYTGEGDMVARYFTTSDLTYDATGHGYTLSVNNGVTSTTVDGVANAAYFNNAGQAASSSVQYARVSTSAMYNDYHFDAAHGMTIMWNAYDLGNSGTNSEYANIFNIHQGEVAPGTLTESQNVTRLAYVSSQLCTGISNGTAISRTDGITAATNRWDNYTAVIAHHGMQVYKNGQLIKSLVLNGIDDTWFENIFSNGFLTLAASLFQNDRAFNGYIYDFRIYNTANQERIARVDNPGIDVPASEAVQAFEDMLTDGKIHLNMAQAYNKYVQYNAAVDRKFYGGEPNLNLEPFTVALQEALTHCTEWTGNVTTTQGKYYGAEAVSNGEYSYHNVIYSEAAIESDWSGTNGSDGQLNLGYGRFKYSLPKAVLVYDKNGSECGAPIILEYGSTSGNAAEATINLRHVCLDQPKDNANDPDTDYVLLKHAWYGNGNRQNMGNTEGGSTWNTWSSERFNSTYQDPKSGDNIFSKNVLQYHIPYKWENNSNVTYYGKKNVCYYAANELFYNPLKGFEDNNGYSSSAVGQELKFHVNVNGNNNGTMYNSNAAIYTINYKRYYEAIRDKLSTYNSSTGVYEADYFDGLDIHNYKEGGLTSFFEKIDQMTSFQPITYFTELTNTVGSNISLLNTAVNNCAGAMSTLAGTNLANVSKTTDSAAYAALRAAIDADLSGSASNYELDSARTEFANPNTKYIQSTYNNFNTWFTSAQTAMSGPYNRRANATGSIYNATTDSAQNNAYWLDIKYRSLMPKVDANTLTTLINAKNDILAQSIFETDSATGTKRQVYTFPSWADFSGTISDSQTVITSNKDQAKYKTYAVDSDHPEEGITNFNELSLYQTNVNNQVIELTASKLVECDTDSAYDTYDAAHSVVMAMDRDKYVDTELTPFDALIDQYDNRTNRAGDSVYIKVTDAEATAYNTATGDSVAANSVLRASAVDTTDALTTNLLTNVNTMAVNQYKSYLTVKVKNEDNSVTVRDAMQLKETKNYGEVFNFNVSVSGDQAVTWEVIGKKGDKVISTREISDYEANTLELKASSDVEVVATISNKAPTTAIPVYIHNIYGNVLEIKYVSSVGSDLDAFVDSLGLDAPVLPLYTFDHWGVYVDEDANAYHIYPRYEMTPVAVITAPIGGGTYALLKQVTISSSDNIYAWAVKNGNKYSIASYAKPGDNSYTFFAVANEEYVPVVKDGDTYKVGDTVLTAAMIDDCVNTSGQRLTEDEFMKAKLDAKMPFTSIRTIEAVQTADNKFKVSLYCRYTANCDVNIEGFGAIVNTGAAQSKLYFKGAAESGQYCPQLTAKSDAYTYASFVTYEFKYLSYKTNIMNTSPFVPFTDFTA